VHRFIKAVGAGAKRARPLTREEAREAMALLASGNASPEQVGAFLLALRMKGESAAELAGFVDGLGDRVARVAAPDATCEVDAHGDGHEGLPSLLPAAAAAASALGVPVLIGIDVASAFAKHGLDAALGSLGFSGALGPARAERDLARAGLAAISLDEVCPPLARLVELRPKLGVRTVAQTLSKLISPTGSVRRLVGIFHAPYLEPTAEALHELGAHRALVVQASGGLPEARPGRLARVAFADKARATSIDLRAFSTEGDPAPSGDAVAANRAALDGERPFARSAAATCALILHAATGADPETAARDGLAALTDGRARAVAMKCA
jgi:anthranilate phosphoribosyltransferase